jgi:formylglycine-generating enzyme required for sulfatase activity
MVAILDASSTKSPAMLFDWGAAVGMGKRVIPVITSDVDPEALPHAFRTRRFIVGTSAVEAATSISQALGARGLSGYTNSIGMKFVLIPAGAFTMGSNAGYSSEEPTHPVKIQQPFYLQATEVTQGQWEKVMGSNPSNFKGCGDDCPVEKVCWNDVWQFIEKLNQAEKTTAYRLPSEAEWEYACRAGSATEFFFGDDDKQLGESAWYSENSKGQTHAVGMLKPNAWGLYDMHGNVWEWVEDDWHDGYNGCRNDGVPWIDIPRGSDRVIRGGSWFSNAHYCRSARRGSLWPGIRYDSVGFRLCRSVFLGS